MQTFVLSPQGNDTDAAGPWITFGGARDALRALRRQGRLTGAARVEIAAGTYHLAAPIVFGSADSQTTWEATPGAQVIVDGGRALGGSAEVTGFTETTHAGRRAWVLDLPEVARGELAFKSLFVGPAGGATSRRPRARFPKFAPTAEDRHHTLRLGEIRFPERRGLFEGDHMFKPAAGDWGDWPSLPDAEIVLLHYWVETRLPGPRLDPRTGWVGCARRSVFNLYESFNPLLARYYVDNLFEALTEPGEWYLDKATGRLTYLPLEGEVLGETEVVAPVVTRFVEVTGQPEKPVRELTFRGLTFRHADWYQPLAEMLPHDHAAPGARVTDVPLGSAPQSAAHVPAAISWLWAHECAFDGNTVELTGFTGLEFGPGCRGNRATGNTFRDLGGGGFKLGGTDLRGPLADRTSHLVVADNVIERVGRVFHQSCGILLTHAHDCQLVHNTIAHTCYTGISVGWVWGFSDNLTHNILVEGNLIRDIGEGVLSDNGGIYLLGVQPGTVVRGNHITRVSAADYGGSGIYPDEGSAHIVIEHNWVHDVQGGCLGIHFARELVVRGNLFERPGEAFAGIGRVESGIQATLLHNRFVGPAKALYTGAYKGDIRTGFATDANELVFTAGEVPPATHPEYRTDVPHAISWAEWQAAGNDLHSVVVAKAGQPLYDWSTCGVRLQGNQE